MVAEYIAAAGSFASGLGSLMGGGGTSRKRERDSYVIAAEEQRKNIGPWLKAVEAAGIHPLIGMGQNPVASPSVSVGGGDSNRLAGLEQMGQGVSRALSAGQNQEQRIITKQAQQLQLENMSLQNDLLRSQITRISEPTTPPMSGANYNLKGQTQSGVVDMLPSEQIHSYPNQPHRQAGTINTYQIDSQGGVVPSEQMKTRIEDDFIAQMMWHLKNRIGREDLPDGRVWSNVNQQYMTPQEYKKTKWSRFRRMLTHQ